MPLTKEQEKAKQLIDKFENVDDCDKHYDDRHSPCSHQAKQCAIICVEQIIESVSFVEDVEYWKEVLKILNDL